MKPQPASEYPQPKHFIRPKKDWAIVNARGIPMMRHHDPEALTRRLHQWPGCSVRKETTG